MNSLRPSEQQLPRAGDVVAGKYRIESTIGAGGMGVVLGAQDTSLGRKVAIKFLAPNKARNEDAAARFLREARAAASLQSEHVVRVFEIGELPNGAAFIVMEHLQGGDLAEVVAGRGPLPFAEAVDYVIEACEALGEAHAKGIVHRDLKPQNLFVAALPDGSPSVKVLDFGISKAMDEASVNLTATDTVMGTPLYMSPEQVRSLKSVDLRSDIWALGAILFELLTASPIFEATTATALCAAIAMDPPIPLRTKRFDAPPALEAVILRCLHKDPAGRYQDVAALSDALAPFASDRGRMSAMRVAGVVRTGGSSPQLAAPANAMATSGFGTTGVVGTNYPFPSPSQLPAPPASHPSSPPGSNPHSPSYPPAMRTSQPPGSSPSVSGTGPTYAVGGMPGAMPVMHSPSQYPPPAVRTQDAWQNQTGAMSPNAPHQRRSNALLFAVVGVVGVFVLLAIVGTAGVFLVARRTAAPDDDPSQSAAATASPPPTVPAAAPPPPAVTGPIVATTPGKKPTAGRDAGAGAATGAPSNGASPTSPDDDPAKLARLKQIAQGRCSLEQGELSRNDASNNGARTVKNQACLAAQSLSPNAGSSNCERAQCRTACTILRDQACIQQLDFAERANPLKF